MITPGKDFQQSDYGKTWNDVIDSPQFQAAAKAALLEFDPKNIDELAGAKRYLGKLMGLCDKPKITRVEMSPNLVQPR